MQKKMISQFLCFGKILKHNSVLECYLLACAVGGFVRVDRHVEHLLGHTGPHIRDQRGGQVLDLWQTLINSLEQS